MFVLAVFSLSACLRYVPSRSELNDDSADNGELAPVGGPEDFKAYEEKLATRLKSFLESRNEIISQGLSAGYILGPGDTIQVDVFGFPDLSTTTTVASDGTVTLTYLNPITVTGLNPVQLQETLKNAYKTYVKSPKVKVEIKQYNSNSVSVMGAVERPGIYPLKGQDVTLTALLSLVGGKNGKAGNRLVLLPASSSGNINSFIAQNPLNDSSGIEIDFADLVGTIDKRPLVVPLLPGDTVIVPEAGSFKVAGEVRKPGSFPLSSKTSVIGAIAAAEGLTYSADVAQVEIVRDIGAGKRASLVVDIEQIARTGLSDVLLRDSDIVVVPSNPGLFRTRQVVEFLNGFFRVSGQVRY